MAAASRLSIASGRHSNVTGTFSPSRAVTDNCMVLYLLASKLGTGRCLRSLGGADAPEATSNSSSESGVIIDVYATRSLPCVLNRRWLAMCASHASTSKVIAFASAVGAPVRASSGQIQILVNPPARPEQARKSWKTITSSRDRSIEWGRICSPVVGKVTGCQLDGASSDARYSARFRLPCTLEVRKSVLEGACDSTSYLTPYSRGRTIVGRSAADVVGTKCTSIVSLLSDSMKSSEPSRDVETPWTDEARSANLQVSRRTYHRTIWGCNTRAQRAGMAAELRTTLKSSSGSS